MLNNGDFVKTLDYKLDPICGTIEKINNDTFVTFTDNVYNNDGIFLGFTKSYLKVYPTNCVKKLVSIELSDYLSVDIFEYDVFKTKENVLFYVYFDYNIMALLYVSEPTKSIPDNLNFFECELVGNLVLNNVFEGIFDTDFD